MIEKTKLTGKELFDLYTSLEGEYKYTLFRAHLEIGDDLFPMLEKCEKEGKKIHIQESPDSTLDSQIVITVT